MRQQEAKRAQERRHGARVVHQVCTQHQKALPDASIYSLITSAFCRSYVSSPLSLSLVPLPSHGHDKLSLAMRRIMDIIGRAQMAVLHKGLMHRA